MKKVLTIAGGFVGIIVLALAGFFLYPHPPAEPAAGAQAVTDTQPKPNPPPEKLPIVTSVPNAPPLKPSRTPPAGYKEYRSEFYRFQFFYPASFSVTEQKGASSSVTLLFAKSAGEGFQLFILPWGNSKISAARFKLDNSSGATDNLTTAQVDGADAAFFYSQDASLGTTFNAWFVGRGFLYELTTYKSYAAQLKQLLKSWQFL